jgi:UDP-2-acetamido-2-deoxy-ribo-hexuluronate aminotransferase
MALLRLTPVLWMWTGVLSASIRPRLSKAITPKTKAIVPVHLYGQAANMEAIMKLAESPNFCN